MNNSLPTQPKFNTPGFLKLTLTTLFLSLLLGGYTRANAGEAQQVEVMSVPPQEAFFIKEKTQTTLPPASNSQQNGHSLSPTRNYVPPTLNAPSATLVRPNTRS